MKKITDIFELNKLTSSHFGKGYVTNYFISKDNAEKYIADGKMYFETVGKSLFIIRRREGFSTLYYCMSCDEVPDFGFLDETTVTETAFRTKDEALINADSLMCDCGFEREFFRKRMVFTNTDTDNVELPTKVRYADLSELDFVYGLLENSFSHMTGCLPTLDELSENIKNSEIILHEDGGVLHYVHGRASFELRHLCVDEKMRGHGISGELVRFYNGIVPKKSLVWVREGYLPAEKTYENNGYTADGMKSSVLIYKKG